jgi:hypothetical protein
MPRKWDSAHMKIVNHELERGRVLSSKLS